MAEAYVISIAVEAAETATQLRVVAAYRTDGLGRSASGARGDADDDVAGTGAAVRCVRGMSGSIDIPFENSDIARTEPARGFLR